MVELFEKKVLIFDVVDCCSEVWFEFDGFVVVCESFVVVFVFDFGVVESFVGFGELWIDFDCGVCCFDCLIEFVWWRVEVYDVLEEFVGEFGEVECVVWVVFDCFLKEFDCCFVVFGLVVMVVVEFFDVVVVGG